MEEISSTHLRILIIENDLCYRKLLERYIQRCGAIVGYASDGKSGLEKALTGDYDLAFVDIQLPQLDGFMVAMLLREQDSELPLIAMTSLRLEGMGHKARAVGFNEFLYKPISESRVLRLLEQYSPFATETADDRSVIHSMD